MFPFHCSLLFGCWMGRQLCKSSCVYCSQVRSPVHSRFNKQIYIFLVVYSFLFKCRVPKDLNCLRIVECITGSDNRTKYLKSQLALHLLIVCFDNKVSSILLLSSKLILFDVYITLQTCLTLWSDYIYFL